jgi:hypothetical protein
LRRELAHALSRSIGSLWSAELQDLTGLVRYEGEALGRWTTDEVRERCAEDDVDCWFMATVHNRGSRRIISVRAWQPQFDWLSPVHETSLYEPRETAGGIVKLCWGLFRPQVLIEHVDQNSVRVRIPAGDLQPADPAFRLFQPGDCLVPWLMYYDRNQALTRRQEVPWTYVRLDDIQGPLADGTVLSGLRTPLAGKTRGRIDKVAVASRPVYPQTTLQIGVQNQPARTLAGYRLELRSKLPERKAADATETKKDEDDVEPPVEEEITKVLTNRLGEITLSPDADRQALWIFVYSGELLLARVPFVPGSLPSLRLDVPDDSVRLQVEGELKGLEGELINLVAERNTLIAATRAASKKGDWKRVAVLRKQLDALPPKENFLARLGGIRVPALNAARSRKDRAGQVRIERLCKDVAELINRYLDPEKLQEIKEEIDLLIRDAQADAKASN